MSNVLYFKIFNFTLNNKYIYLASLHSCYAHSNENQHKEINSSESYLVFVGQMGSNFYDRDTKEFRVN